MAFVVNDRVKETSTTTGTGTLTLDGAVTGFETFSSAIGNTNTTYYAIELPNTAEFEVGLGTVSAGQLARTTVISSSNSDALVNFSAGTKNVFCTLPASKAVIKDASDNVIFGDNEKAQFGDSNDLEIYHNGTNSYIDDSGTGILLIRSDSRINLRTKLGNEEMLEANPNGSVELYYDNSKKIETTNTGATITGTLISDGLTVDTNTLYVDSSNNRVGINDSTPSQSLDVSGRSRSTRFVSSTGGAAADAAFYLNDTNGLGIFSPTANEFAISTSASERLRIDSSGDFGFGYSTPTNFITVVNPSDIPFMIHSTDPNNEMVMSDTTGSIKFGTKNSGDFLLLTGGDAGAAGGPSSTSYFAGGSTEVLRVTSGGNVGIGTSSPSTLLHLSSADPQITITDTDGTGSQVIKAVTDDLTLDVVGKTVIDSDNGGTLQLLDGGTSYLKFFEFGTYAALESMISDNDFKIRGNDGGSFIDALTLDMSEAGAATFNSSVTVGANLDVSSGTIKLDGNYPEGSENVVLGDAAGDALTGSSSSNTLIGHQAGTDMTIGTFNTAVGTSSLANITQGVGNVGVGNSTLGSETTNNSSTAVGESALGSQNGGSNNTALGASAGTSVTTGSNLTLLGYNAEPSSATATNEITLGDANVTSLRIPGLQSGASSGDVLTYDGTDIGFATPSTGIAAVVDDTTPQLGGNLDVNGNQIVSVSNGDIVIAPDGTGTVDINGNLDVDGGTIKLDGNYPLGTRNTVLGDSAGTAIIAGGNDNVFIGNSAGSANTTGDNNIGIGTDAVNSVTTNGSLIGIGVRALKTATSAKHIAIGYEAAEDLTTANSSISIGFRANNKLTTGFYNTAIGETVLEDNLTGYANTGVGALALRNCTSHENTAVGYYAGQAITNSSGNVIVGNNALVNATGPGGGHTAIGAYALTNATGQLNTGVGREAGRNITTGDNNICIGYNAQPSSATVDNEITLGDANITSLRIPGLASGASSGDVLTYDGTDITLSAPTGVSAGFSIAMAIAL